MATNFPGSLDSGTQQPSPSASTEMDDSGFEHDVVHTNHSGAIIALETKLGTGDSNAVSNSVLAGTGSGTSGWTTGTLANAISGNAATATALATARAINGVDFNGTAPITVTAAAGTLTGGTLASGVTASSITSLGTLGSLTVTGDATFDTSTLKVDSTNNRVGIGTTSPETPLSIVAANSLGSTFTGTAAGEGLRVDQSNYSSGNYVSLVESSYDDGQSAPHVRIAAMFDGSGSNLAFGTSSTYSSGITNTALNLDSTGLLTSPRSYSATTGNAANLYVDTDGSFYRSTAGSIRLKTDVEDAGDSYADAVLNLRPIWYRSLSTADRRDWSHWGLVAEEVAEIDPRLVTWGWVPILDDDGTQQTEVVPVLDADGEPTYADGEPVTRAGSLLWETDDNGDPVIGPDGVQYTKIVPLLINIIKRQAAQIEETMARVAALEAA